MFCCRNGNFCSFEKGTEIQLTEYVKNVNAALRKRCPSAILNNVAYELHIIKKRGRDYDSEKVFHKVYGKKTIEVRSKNTSYRGDVLICSAASPVYPGMESGVTLGLVELYDVKPIKEFTPEDWENTRIPKEKRAKITKGYGWLMRNPRRVIEFPVKGQLGIYNLVYTKGCIVEYPKVMVLDKEAYNKIKETY